MKYSTINLRPDVTSYWVPISSIEILGNHSFEVSRTIQLRNATKATQFHCRPMSHNIRTVYRGSICLQEQFLTGFLSSPKIAEVL